VATAAAAVAAAASSPSAEPWVGHCHTSKHVCSQL